jgi:serine/threonine protein kinase
VSVTVVSQSGKRYTRGQELGRGSFGVVYLATDEENQQFALKLIGPVLDGETQESFEREIRGAQGVENEHVLRVVDFGTHEAESGDLYLFTIAELCPDGSYRRRMMAYSLTQQGALQIVADFHQILDGLRALHTCVIHRDLKPENVFDRGGVLKIGDFGLSRFVDQSTRTLTFKGLGSPQYMAPEVWTMHRTTPATDLYAIGVMLFEALTHEAPFAARGDLNVLRNMHLFMPAPRAKSINKHVPDKLDGVVKKLLAKEPSDRYQSADELIVALGDVQPIVAGDGVTDIAARLRLHHDAMEKKRLNEQRQSESALTEMERNRYKERELQAAISEVISEINAQLAEIKIRPGSDRGSIDWHLGDRSLVLHFFSPGELYQDPEVQGRMAILRQRNAVHAGYIEVRENGEDREGWNVVLVRPPESLYGQWFLVETDVSALTGRSARYRPFATQAKLLADNLACHWTPAMHTYVLKDKPLDRTDIVKILGVFAG